MADIRATYRLQLRPGFGFAEAAALADYLAALGVSHLYCSPILQAGRGSTHGYDVVDHGRLNAELGGPEGHAAMVEALRAHRLGQVLDVVPNHMAIAPENNWWQDVLENGPSSHFAAYFDVEWDPPEARLRNTVLLPVLADHYGRVLEAGALRLERTGARFTVRYGEHVFPLDPRSLAPLLATAARRCASPHLAFLAEALARLPRATATDRESVARRHRDKEILRSLLDRLLADEPACAGSIDETLEQYNADPDALHTLLEAQNYRLAWWRSAGRDLGYRRFFDINTLVGLRIEDENVFADTHRLVLGWLADGTLDGLRIDHPDGLQDPEQYLARLARAAPGAWIVVEKILAGDEELPESWPVAGTTGYEFLNRVLGLPVDPRGEAPLTELYAEFTGQPADWLAMAREKKRFVLREVLGSDVNRLAALFLDVCEQDRRHRDYSRHQLTDALREVIACLPVYRTYVRPLTGRVPEAEAARIAAAIEAARAERPDLEAALFDFLADLLLLRARSPLADELVLRFQQVTGPAMAKGVEDTAFYTYTRFVALNEVGGDPARFGMAVEAFHDASAAVQSRWPRTMASTDTHDTKRGEDVRARLALLSEIPGEWAATVRRWAAINAPHRTGDLPDRAAEYLFYQTLVGAWPLELDRALAYMEKATREAKTHTSWTTPDPRYEAALQRFVSGAGGDAVFAGDVERFVTPLVEPGRVNALAQKLICLTAPGIPDLYQGTELWALTLVDPDNRRPVDWERRRRLLGELEGVSVEEVVRRGAEGLPKLLVVQRALALRQARPELFGPAGAYEPLAARGARAEHVVAFMRGGGAVTVVPRLVLGLGGDWKDTRLDLPEAGWTNVLTGEAVPGGEVAVASLLERFPVALLVARPR